MVIKRKATPFFTDEEFRDVIVNESQDSTCMECGLYKNCISPKMPVTGKGKKEILILSEGPGKNEDEQNKQLIGEAGQLLRSRLKECGLSLDEDFWKTNAVTCFISPKISVYTSKGYKQIKDVKVGDLVLTHKGRFKKVLSRVHDLPLEKRKNKENLVCIKTKYGDYTVTEAHGFLLSNEKWTKAKHLCIGDKIKVLGEKCIVCGNIYFKNPQVFDRAESTCSQRCHNIATSKKSGAAVSQSLKTQFELGIRDRNKITRKANIKYKQLIKTGWRASDFVDPENFKKGRCSTSKKKESFNKLHKGITVGKGEKELSKWLVDGGVDFYHQYSVGCKNFDFYIPNFNLLIEIENPITYKCNRKIKDIRYIEREKIAKENKLDLVFVSSDTCVNEVKRVLKNHSGDYAFTETEVLDVKIYKQKRQEYLYCIEVEDDNSFVSGGLVSHNCRPPKNRKPKRKELKCCKPNYVKLINELKPKFIWLVGAAAIESYYMDHFADDDGTVLTPTRWRGLCIPDQMSGAWVLPMFHPSFALRNEKDNLLQSQFNRDISFAVNQLQRKAPKFIHPEKRVTVLKEFDDVCDNLEKLIYEPPEFLAFDYETTGLKPFNEGHKIACIGYAVDDRAYSFPFGYPHFTAKQVSTLKKMWGEVLRNDSYKIAHNLKYEDVWSRVIIGSLVQNWHWCTMNAAHILDNRKKFSSLKFQSFIRWGVGQYDKTISPFLKDKTGSGFNRVMEADLDDLLLYNGLDCLLTMKLYREQYNEMPVPMMKANDFFIDGLIALSDVQINGIPAKRRYYEKTDKELDDRMKEITKELLVSKEAKKFEKEMGRTISLTSDYDMRDLFFKILKYTPSKSTDTGLPSVDAMALRALNSQFANKLIELSQLDKIKTTYIGQFLREINDDGKLHPFFDLHTVQTYRSSSAGPNIQNIPSRDPVAKKYTRSGLYPSPGNLILDFDYGALEVRIIGACTGDPELVRYINDPSTDMHRDQAMSLFDLKKKEVTKMLRFHAKNGFVFAEFYGSYYRSIARSLWETMNRDQLKTATDVNIFDHLMDNKIINHEKDFDKFESHVKDVEQSFWDRFSGVKKWQKRNWDFYERNGYVELATGFRCSGYMKRNDLANYPIQGPAFHCLLYSLININDELKRRKMGTKIIGQIHDCCLFDCVPSEKEAVKEMSIEIATKKIRQDWKWLNVPVVLEFEETKVDESWYSKKEVREE
mgnify:CR=1 FL=1